MENKDDPVGTLLGPDGKEIKSIKKQEPMGYGRGNPRVGPEWRKWGRTRDDTTALRFDAQDSSTSDDSDI